MTEISRYPIPELSDLPDDIREMIEQVQEKSGFIPNIFLGLAHRPDEFRLLLRLPRRDSRAEGEPHEGRQGDDRGGDERREQLPVLRGGTRCDPPHPREGSAHRRSGGRELSQRRPRTAAASDSRLRAEDRNERRRGRTRATTQALEAHGLDRDDIWDIGAISAFFALSNRMAHLMDLKPNAEFYTLGRG